MKKKKIKWKTEESCCGLVSKHFWPGIITLGNRTGCIRCETFVRTWNNSALGHRVFVVNKCRYGKRYRVRYASYGLIIIEGSAFIYIIFFCLLGRVLTGGRGGGKGVSKTLRWFSSTGREKNFIRGVAIYPTERRKVRRQVEEERKRKTDPATDRRRTVNKTFMGSKKKKKPPGTVQMSRAFICIRGYSLRTRGNESDFESFGLCQNGRNKHELMDVNT